MSFLRNYTLTIALAFSCTHFIHTAEAPFGAFLNAARQGNLTDL